jgi:hypothetical protein
MVTTGLAALYMVMVAINANEYTGANRHRGIA